MNKNYLLFLQIAWLKITFFDVRIKNNNLTFSILTG